jgi:N-formylglutamate deformylase
MIGSGGGRGIGTMAAERRPSWLSVQGGSAPLLLCMPHTGTDIPPGIEKQLHSQWLARKDTDWWVERLYAFAPRLGASVVRTALSRSVIDVNRDPSGASLYPGQATTALCPTTTFDGEALYRAGAAPQAQEIEARRREYFEPYHAAVRGELARLRAQHAQVVLYDCHSIRSRIPRLFSGSLPHFNIGSFNGASCDPRLARAIEAVCATTGFSRVTNGRFQGGYTTRHYGRPAEGVHAVQMELACRGYMHEELGPVSEKSWPTPYDPVYAAPMRATLTRILQACLDFARA